MSRQIVILLGLGAAQAALLPCLHASLVPPTLSVAAAGRRGTTICARYVEGMSDLDEDAAALLEEAQGDVDKARTSYIGYTLAYLEEAMPELYEALKSDPKRPDAHAALVEVTWDSIAAFLPVTHDSKPTAEAQKRLTVIARAAYDGTGPPPARFLDVGCGNGLLLPFAAAVGCPPESYRGIDLSSRMIETARKTHSDQAQYKGATFDDKSFDDVLAEEAAGSEGGDPHDGYDAIIFNGSLQFFAELRVTLRAAARILKKGPGSRLVLAHVSGAAFVRREQEENPMTVLSSMPSLSAIGEVASELGMLAVTPTFMGSEAEEIERVLEDFFVVVLRWDEANGGVDGEGGVGEAV